MSWLPPSRRRSLITWYSTSSNKCVCLSEGLRGRIGQCISHQGVLRLKGLHLVRVLRLISSHVLPLILHFVILVEVVVIRGQQHVTPARQDALSRRFGELYPHIMDQYRLHDLPGVHVVSNEEKDGRRIGVDGTQTVRPEQMHATPQ